jgi:hypothetical protein
MAHEATFRVAAGEVVPLVLSYMPSYHGEPPGPDAGQALEETRKFWDQWASRCTYQGTCSEEYDRRYGRLVGNMPQAFSHVPLVQTALNLSSHAGEHQRGTGMHRDERRSVPG